MLSTIEFSETSYPSMGGFERNYSEILGYRATKGAQLPLVHCIVNTSNSDFYGVLHARIIQISRIYENSRAAASRCR